MAHIKNPNLNFFDVSDFEIQKFDLVKKDKFYNCFTTLQTYIGKILSRVCLVGRLSNRSLSKMTIVKFGLT